MNWIKEENYEKTMTEVVAPYLAERREEGFFERVWAEPIYFEHYRADAPKGVIVISHGFTESIRKFSESIYYMLQAGFEVWGLDHRGHGRSFRENENPYVVHVSRFQDYVLDLRHLVETKVQPASNGLPVYLYGHSMGGCVGAWIIEDYPALFRKAVLTSPMLGLSFGRVPVAIMYAGASIRGFGERRKEPMKPVSSFQPDDFENSCDSSRCRFEYYLKKRLSDPLLQTTSPSMGWGMEAVKACARVSSRVEARRVIIPVLLFQAGNEAVVKSAAQDAFAERVPSCSLHRVPGVKHEIYMSDSEVLIPYWEEVFAFFGD